MQIQDADAENQLCYTYTTFKRNQTSLQPLRNPLMVISNFLLTLITACSLHFTEHQFLVPGLCCAQLPMLKMTLVLTLRQTGSGLLKPSWLLLPGVQLSWSAPCALCTATLHSASRTFTTQLCSVDCTQLYTTVQDRVCCLNKTTVQYTQRHHFIESFRHNDILL